MTIYDLMVRAYVRHVMFLATFPYHVLQELRGDRASAADTEASAPSIQTKHRQ